MDKTRKTKKTYRLLLVLLVLTMPVLALVSCSGNVYPEQYGTVSFSSMCSATKDLSAVVQHLDKTDLYWRYTAVKKDNGGTSGCTAGEGVDKSVPVSGQSGDSEVWNKGLDQQHVFAVGTWEFTLYGFSSKPASLDEYGYVYKGTLTTKVTTDTSQSITVSVFPVSSETNSGTTKGTLDFTGVTCSSGTLKYKIDDDNWAVAPQTADVSIGSHSVEIGYSSSGDPTSSETIYLTIYRGLKTKLIGSV